MENITEREHGLVVRGDIALTTLEAVKGSLSNTEQSLAKSIESLRGVKQKAKTDGTTLLDMVLSALEQTHAVIADNVRLIEGTTSEMAVLTDVLGFPVQSAQQTFLDAVRACSVVYKDKTDDELRELCGL